MKINFYSSKFSKTVILVLFMSSIIIITSCESIPPGTPPDGPIVSINTTDEIPLSPDNAINDMTTAIATSPVLYEYGDIPTVSLQGQAISEELKDFGENLGYLTSHLFRNIAEMDMVKLPVSLNSNKINFTICSTFSKSYCNNSNKLDNNEIIIWKLELLSPNNRCLWEQSLKVKVIKKNKDKNKLSI